MPEYDWRVDPRRYGKEAGSIGAIDPAGASTGIGGALGKVPGTIGVSGGIAGGMTSAKTDPARGLTSFETGSGVGGATQTRTDPDAIFAESYLGGVRNPYGSGLGAPEPNTTIFDQYAKGYTESMAAAALQAGVGGPPPGSGPGGAPSIESILYGVKMHESGGSYTIQNQSGSSASGAYQYLDSTWNNYGGYSRAMYAPPEVQDARARADFQAAYNKYGNWDQAIMSHFGGPGFASDPSNWSSIPGSPGYGNPTGQAFLDSVYEKAGASPASAPIGPSATGDGQMTDAISAAMGMVGTMYVWGGSSSSGVDCSGLVYYAYNQAGINIPRMRAIDYGKMGSAVTLDQARPGDIIYTDNPNTTTDHVGIYLGNGQMVVAPTTGQKVQVDSVGNYTSIRRIAPDSAYGSMSSDGMGGMGYSLNGQSYSTMPQPQYSPEPFRYTRPAFSSESTMGRYAYAMV